MLAYNADAMKAWIKGRDGLRLDEVPAPAQNSDELLLRVEAISLNRGELRSVRRATEGTIPGWDVAGTVVAPHQTAKDQIKVHAWRHLCPVADGRNWSTYL